MFDTRDDPFASIAAYDNMKLAMSCQAYDRDEAFDRLRGIAETHERFNATMDDPNLFLVHDINFHRAVAAASGNPIVASLVEMVSALYYEQRRQTAARASDRDLRDAAEMHRKIYQAIRAHQPEDARNAMHTHLDQASAHQAQEPVDLESRSQSVRGRSRHSG